MVISVVMASDFSRVTSTTEYTLEQIYSLMSQFDWDAWPAGTGYVSVSIYTDAD
jgi:hypothetical protein